MAAHFFEPLVIRSSMIRAQISDIWKAKSFAHCIVSPVQVALGTPARLPARGLEWVAATMLRARIDRNSHSLGLNLPSEVVSLIRM